MIEQYVGIDPGTSGCLCTMDRQGKILRVDRCPVIVLDGKRSKKTGKIGKRTIVDVAAMAALLKEIASTATTKVMVERVNPMPGEGVSSVWTFASAYWSWLALCAALGIPYDQVHPMTWKKKMLPGSNKNKNASLVKVKAAYPDLKIKDHNGADALLLAEYLRQQDVVLTHSSIPVLPVPADTNTLAAVA